MLEIIIGCLFLFLFISVLFFWKLFRYLEESEQINFKNINKK